MDTVSSGTANEINGYQWKVTEKGTYYTENGTTRVPNDVTFTSCGDSATGVTITTQGGEDDKATRHAKVTVTNDKTECGSITVSKTLLRNGVPDEKAHTNKTVVFGLYTDENAEHPVKVNGSNENRTVTVTLGVDADGHTTYTTTESVLNSSTGKYEDTIVERSYGESWGSKTFDNLPYETVVSPGAADEIRTPITYYVFELENKGTSGSPDWQPIKNTKAQFSFDSEAKEYVVAGKTGVYELSHGADTRDITVKYTNSLIEKGKIKVTKRIVDENGAVQTDATGTFKVGLFTLDDNKTPETKSDDKFVLVKGRAYTVEVKSGGTGEVSFENLDFDVDNGTTYYVFEVDEQNRPVVKGEEVAGYKVDYEGTKIDDIPTDTYGGQKFTLTAAQHDFDGATPTGSQTANPGGATIKNIATESEFQIVKVDRQSWEGAPAGNKDDAKKLVGAEFTMRQIKPDQAFSNSGVAYANETTITQSADTNGVARFEKVGTGYYEIKETKSPTGYLVVGDSTVYLKVSGGQVKFLQKGSGAPNTWEVINEASYQVQDGSNLMSYAKAVEASGGSAAVPATVTVGNVAGPELPSTGGPGLYPLLFTGVALALASALALALETVKRG